MTRLLERALKKLKGLPEDKQDNIASLIIDEVAWEKRFNKSKDGLDILAKKVSQEIKAGKFKKI